MKTFLFLAAGGAWVNITGHVVNEDGIPFFDSFRLSRKAIAPALGCGVEYAVSEKISARAKLDVISPHTYTRRDNVDNTYQIASNIVQGTFGINYRFA
jgi:opacity protein-like surface antigen